MATQSIKIFWQYVFSELMRLLRVFRIQSPSGLLLLFYPGLWGHILTQKQIHSGMMLFIFCIALWARSLGCFLNDWVDRSLDQHVTRTQNRPLVLAPPSACMLIWVCFFSLFPFLFLFFFYTPSLCFLMLLGALSAALYPWCKRWTFYPQSFLATSFNLIIFFDPVFSNQSITPKVIVMYFWSFLWTFFYDTIYAFQDVKEDKKWHIKSTAVLWGPQKGRKILNRLFFLRYAITLLIMPSMTSVATLFCIMLYAFNVWQKTDLNKPESCAKTFKKILLEGLFISFWLLGL